MPAHTLATVAAGVARTVGPTKGPDETTLQIRVLAALTGLDDELRAHSSAEREDAARIDALRQRVEDLERGLGESGEGRSSADDPIADAARHQRTLAFLIRELDGQVRAAQTRRDVLRRQLQLIRDSRTACTRMLPSVRLTAYEALVAAGVAPALSQPKEGRCGVCEVVLPAAILAEIREGLDIPGCPRCRRLLAPS